MQIAYDHHSPDTIRAALSHIPANLPRDEWAKLGMAIKSEFPDETGLDLFTEWSATAASFDAKACRDTWRSIKAGGGVGIGTLLHMAKANGFHLPKPDQAPHQPDPEAVARLERERAQRQQAEQAQAEAAQARATAEAVALWEAASEASEHPYLARKGRFSPSILVVVIHPHVDCPRTSWLSRCTYEDVVEDGAARSGSNHGYETRQANVPACVGTARRAHAAPGPPRPSTTSDLRPRCLRPPAPMIPWNARRPRPSAGGVVSGDERSVRDRGAP